MLISVFLLLLDFTLPTVYLNYHFTVLLELYCYCRVI